MLISYFIFSQTFRIRQTLRSLRRGLHLLRLQLTPAVLSGRTSSQYRDL